MKLNLAERFLERAQEQPDHPLVLGPEAGDRISYGEFHAKVLAMAKTLGAAGVNSGNNVGLVYPSGADYIAFVYALWACGACVTPLPLESTASEKREVFRHIHLDGVIAGTRFAGELGDLIGPSVDVTPNAIHAMIQNGREAPSQLAQVNPAFIRFTSGTTGSAKGVVLSHESIHERIHAANQALRIAPSDRVMWLLSMDYHFTVSIVAYLTFGATIILPKNTFGVTMLEAATRHDATFIYASPTHYRLMVHDDTGARLPEGLRLAIVTTSALRTEIADAFYGRFGRVLNETYGIIELGLPAINVSNLIEKQGSVGRPLPAYDLRLDCFPGEEHGEITLRAAGMLDAYYSPWQSREAILRQGGSYFRTGDLGRLDSDGFLYIVGRVKEMISIGGMKFFPDEVECVLERHPGIRAASVFGIEDDQWGEACVAHLVPAEGYAKADEDELRAHCRRYLASHKVPRRFHWVEHLSYTASGKKLRNAEKLAAMA